METGGLTPHRSPGVLSGWRDGRMAGNFQQEEIGATMTRKPGWHKIWWGNREYTIRALDGADALRVKQHE